ncbi:MAG: CRTAC1 family protein [Bryobacterales bacterium]|nr:CRTAC1 family protein [Bryobacterales bacterium]
MSLLLNRRSWLSALAAPLFAQSPGVRFTDVTAAAGLAFRHGHGGYGAKLLPETLGPGCAILDYDQDGWPDLLLVNGQDWPGHRRERRSALTLLRNNGNGTFTDVTRRAGLDVEMYGLGVAVADFDNDGFPDLYITAVGQSRLFRNNGRGGFTDVTQRAGLGGREGFSTSAVWFDYDRDGHLDLFVCNYVRWSQAQDVHCSLDGKTKSYCTPEAYRGATCWLFRNRGNGTFEDVTARSGIFDPSSKSLGVAALDFDNDGWPGLFVANDTQPNKLYRNNRNGTFSELAVRQGIAFSEDGRARAGMGVDVGDFARTGRPGIAITNFDNEMMGLYELTPGGYRDAAIARGVGGPSRDRLGFSCLFGDFNLDGHPDLVVLNGHIDDTVRRIGRGVSHAQVPHLFLNDGAGRFRDVAPEAGEGFRAPKIGRGMALGDFDRDGDLDLLVTTNGGPAYLYRNDTAHGNRSIRFRLRGVKSNRDAIGATVVLFDEAGSQTQTVKSASGYLSSSEQALTFGVGRARAVARVVARWPSGRIDEAKNLEAGRTYAWTEGEAPRALEAR